MAAMGIPLGPFSLSEPLGRGGMGVVWAGVHLDQQVPVAIKVLHRSIAVDPESHRNFRNEVRAVAGLDHPGIVWVFETGVVTAHAAKSSSGRLPEGSPYLAMEYASQGTLSQVGALKWAELRRMLFALLDALAHAHARNVIHRDLKPGNILVCGPDDLRPGLKLADFGIATALGESDVATRTGDVRGTLHYMAPEQIRNRRDEYGPWTDLYALGNVAWALAAGRLPFAGRSGLGLLQAQLTQSPGTLVEYTCPEGFHRWLEGLLAKEPQDRFQSAADAAAALKEIGGGDWKMPTLPGIPALSEGPGGETGVLHDLVGVDVLGVDAAAVGARVTARLDAAAELGSATTLILPEGAQQAAMTTGARATVRHAQAHLVRARLPEDWRTGLPRRSLRLLGAGLGLWGLRTIPMVGREEDRDRLWHALKSVHDTREAHVVLIEGLAGTGKSRLARWLAERALEVGGAQVLRAAFTPGAAADEPLRTMWLQYLHATRLDQWGRRERMARFLGRLGSADPAAAERFSRLLLPSDAHGLDSATRHIMTRLLLERLAADRPVMVWVDDVHWGVDGLAFASHVLDAAQVRPAPLLVVLTARDEVLADRPDERALVERLCGREHTTRIRLDPLRPQSRMRLIEELLGLSPVLAQQVEERTAGNPLFAVQLIGDWVERGVLSLGPTGFEFKQGASAQLPDSMHQVWEERLERVLDGLPGLAGQLLERAAVLGLAVDAEEWQRVCDDPDGRHASIGKVRFVPKNARLRHQLVERLLDARLAEETALGFTFAHALLRETLVARANRAGRLEIHHRACAAILRANGDPADIERVGRHLLSAGAVEDALEPLLEGVAHLKATSGFRGALALVGRCEEAMEALPLPSDDARWGHVWVQRATLYTELGELDEAERWARRVRASASRHGWTRFSAESHLRLGRIEMYRGRLTEAHRAFEAVVSIADEHGDRELVGWARYNQAVVAAQRGDGKHALRAALQATELLQPTAGKRVKASCLRLIGNAALVAGALDEAEKSLEGARRISEKLGHVLGQAETLGNLGEVRRARGQMDEARGLFEASARLYELAGSTQAVYPRVNLAQLDLAAGAYVEAHASLYEAAAILEQQGRARLLPGLPLLLAAASAGLGDWAAFDHQLDRFAQLEGEPTHPDFAEAAEKAGALAKSAGMSERALRAWRIAIGEWRRLGDTKAVMRLSRFVRG